MFGRIQKYTTFRLILKKGKKKTLTTFIMHAQIASNFNSFQYFMISFSFPLSQLQINTESRNITLAEFSMGSTHTQDSWAAF